MRVRSSDQYVSCCAHKAQCPILSALSPFFPPSIFRSPYTAGTCDKNHSWHIVESPNRNLALSFAAGNATIWKPSPTTPLCSIAVTKIVSSVLERNGVPGAAAGLVTGGKTVGERVVGDSGVDMGKAILRACMRSSQLMVLNQCLSLEVNTSGAK
jgi:hypothetical protein